MLLGGAACQWHVWCGNEDGHARGGERARQQPEHPTHLPARTVPPTFMPTHRPVHTGQPAAGGENFGLVGAGAGEIAGR